LGTVRRHHGGFRDQEAEAENSDDNGAQGARLGRLAEPNAPAKDELFEHLARPCLSPQARTIVRLPSASVLE